MSRKFKFSKNWLKAKQRVSQLDTHIANVRRDFMYKASNTISNKAKSGLNKSILDQDWFEFRHQLEYKLAWQGGQLIAVPPQYTSQRCSCCGTVDKANRITQARFVCTACGYIANADVNAAMNIKAAGHAVFASREVAQSGTSVKYKPTEQATNKILS